MNIEPKLASEAFSLETRLSALAVAAQNMYHAIVSAIKSSECEGLLQNEYLLRQMAMFHMLSQTISDDEIVPKVEVVAKTELTDDDRERSEREVKDYLQSFSL